MDIVLHEVSRTYPFTPCPFPDTMPQYFATDANYGAWGIRHACPKVREVNVTESMSTTTDQEIISGRGRSRVSVGWGGPIDYDGES